MQTPTYLVVGVTGVTRFDLTGAILSAVPSAQILCARTLAEAARLLHDSVTVVAAIINGGQNEVAQSAIGAALQRASARIVLLGEVAEEEAHHSPFHVLQRPFGTDEIFAALEISPPDTH